MIMEQIMKPCKEGLRVRPFSVGIFCCKLSQIFFRSRQSLNNKWVTGLVKALNPQGLSRLCSPFHTPRAKQPSGNWDGKRIFHSLIHSTNKFWKADVFFLSSHLAPGFLDRALVQVSFKATDSWFCPEILGTSMKDYWYSPKSIWDEVSTIRRQRAPSISPNAPAAGAVA